MENSVLSLQAELKDLEDKLSAFERHSDVILSNRLISDEIDELQDLLETKKTSLRM